MPHDAQVPTPGRRQRGVSRIERPGVAVDVAVLTAKGGTLRALLVTRTTKPYKGQLALAGGLIRLDESLDAAALRVLSTKAGLQHVYLEQLYTFGRPGRDPRMRVIAVAYVALVHSGLAEACRAAGACWLRVRVPWQGEVGGPVDILDDDGRKVQLAFDHADVLGMAVKRIRGKLNYTPIGFQLLAEQFTLRELQDVHETILGVDVNKDSFRRRMLTSGDLEATGERENDVDHRPAELYRFTRRSAI